MSSKLQQLIKYLRKLPGVGPRQAARLALAMLDWPQADLDALAETAGTLKSGVQYCRECFNLTEKGELCAVCASPKRDHSQIAVVERLTDLEAIEKTSHHSGVYHVLGGTLNPAKGVQPANLRISELTTRLSRMIAAGINNIEVILATNPDTHGEMTALYLTEELSGSPVRITRLARGLATGSTVEYADPATLANALKHRK